jgi:hypothetical protein
MVIANTRVGVDIVVEDVVVVAVVVVLLLVVGEVAEEVNGC